MATKCKTIVTQSLPEAATRRGYKYAVITDGFPVALFKSEGAAKKHARAMRRYCARGGV